jgi:multidrug efflux pump subunit AcrB
VRGAVAWFARNPVAANLLMLFLVVGGLTTLPKVPQKEFVDIDVDIILVAVAYPGAAPEEVEEGVCVRIEEELDGIEGIEKLTSTSAEGACAVAVQLVAGADARKALDDVKSRVDALDTLPDETESPVVERATIRRSVIDVALSGPLEERSLKELADRVRDEVAALPGITQVDVTGARPYEISIEVSEAALRRFGLTFDQVAEAVRRASLDLPGGALKTEGGEILLRTKGQAYWGPEFAGLVLLTHPDGTRLTIGEMARVVDGFEDTDQATTFDGEPAVMVRVFRVGKQDVLQIVGEVRRYVAEAQARMPEGVKLTVWRDQSVELRGRIDTMLRNGRAGFLLVLAVLAIFLRARLAFWVALGVPVAFAGAIWTLPLFDISIDVISLFAFIVVLGILVDDAIVVGENVYTHQQRGEDRLDAAVKGTQEVTVPVIFGVLTTVVAFTPMLLVEGVMGQVFSVMAIVVIACLLFSLLEVQLVLPAHLGHGRAEGAKREPPAFVRAWRRFQDRFAAGLERFIHGPYRRGLETVLAWRYLTAALAFALLACAAAVVAGGHMRFSFFPPVQANYVTAALTMPQGTPAWVTAEGVAQIAEAAERLREELDAEFSREGASLIRHVLTAVGEHPTKEAQNQGPPSTTRAVTGAHLGEVALELVPAERRTISTEQVEKRWRALLGPIPDAEEVLLLSSLFSAGEEINVELQGPDIDALREAADRVKGRLAEYPGVIDIADSFRLGKQEVKLSILPAAQVLGVTLADLGRQVRQAFYGEEAQRVQRGRHDVKVMVRYPEEERRSLGDLENMRIRTADGSEVPFATVARAELGRGYSTIRRADRQRVINVTADVDRARVTADQVLSNLQATVLPEILRDYPGMSYRFEGIQREQRKAMGGLIGWAGVALFAIYALLAVPLRSYVQPLLIMSVIPFGMVGAIAGHLLMRLDLSFLSVVGMVALTGVVVNASLMLVYTLNRLRDAGASLREALLDAGTKRFRPILLTALTTFAGLTPLLLERSIQAQFLIPMATSLAFGVLFATLITLFLLPSGILVLDDLRALPARLRARAAGRAAREAPERRGGTPAPAGGRGA